MARFAAKFGQYRHGIRNGRWMVLEDGQRQELTKELIAVFRRGILTEDEMQQAIRGMVYNGLPIDRDTEEHFTPRPRISGFDSFESQNFFGWTDQERELVEHVLRTSPMNGQEFIELTSAPAAKPWPAYDELGNAEQILSIAKSIGVSLDDVVKYERENQNREEILEVLEGQKLFEEKDEVVRIEA